MRRRALVLERETLAELAAADLAGVVGAEGGLSGATCPLAGCVGISRDHTCVDCLTRACA